MANAKTSTKTTTVKKKKNAGPSKLVLTSEPKYSKVARRFYNENFMDPSLWLSKVLAAAGGVVCSNPCKTDIETRVDLAKDMIYVNGNRINVVVIGHPALHMALIVHYLNLKKEQLGSFHLDDGSVSVIDFPNWPAGRGVILFRRELSSLPVHSAIASACIVSKLPSIADVTNEVSIKNLSFKRFQSAVETAKRDLIENLRENVVLEVCHI
ncbi:hypothetical protein GIB67_013581 [Kingdonia uniflora]|uniref:Uncharacterized protein n=1 Tax=Kingdonia uniflora TaxID=39325 RepID=A0A7J7KV43_9MAGN|nr:hypothetical protein GIB67_013581 [Kingdonia uniflora]